MADSQPIIGRKIEDESWMAPDRKPNPTNDAFSKTISDDERKIVLGGPTPIIIQAIEETLVESGDDTLKQATIQKAISATMRQSQIPNAVQTFVKRVNGDDQENFAPYVEAKDSEYLGIICGFINATRTLNKTEPEKVDEISEKFSNKAHAKLLSSPDRDLDKKSVFVIANNFNKDPDY